MTKTLEKASMNAPLDGVDKAAVLLRILGEERAAKVFRHLSDEEVEEVSLAIAAGQPIGPAVAQQVIGEVVSDLVGRDDVAEGGVDYARSVLERALGSDKAQNIVGRVMAAIEQRPFEFLGGLPPEEVMPLLRGESLQVTAVVVAYLHTSLAAKVLSLLPEDDQVEVAFRIAHLGDVSPEAVRIVEDVVRKRIVTVPEVDLTAAGGVKALADILNNSERAMEKTVLEQLQDRSGELADEIRMLLFTFEDVTKLEDRDIQLILKEVDQKDLAIALRGVSDATSNRIFSNMSQRGAELLKEEIEYQPPQRRQAVQDAQSRIVGVVRKLEESGALVIARPGGGGEDELV